MLKVKVNKSKKTFRDFFLLKTDRPSPVMTRNLIKIKNFEKKESLYNNNALGEA